MVGARAYLCCRSRLALGRAAALAPAAPTQRRAGCEHGIQNDMSHLGQSRPHSFRGIVRDVFVLVLAEAVVLAFAWCLSPGGRALLARLFSARRRPQHNSPPIDV